MQDRLLFFFFFLSVGSAFFFFFFLTHYLIVPSLLGRDESRPGKGCHALCHIELVLISPQPQDASVVFFSVFIPNVVLTFPFTFCLVVFALFSLFLSELSFSDLFVFLSVLFLSLMAKGEIQRTHTSI